MPWTGYTRIISSRPLSPKLDSDPRSFYKYESRSPWVSKVTLCRGPSRSDLIGGPSISTPWRRRRWWRWWRSSLVSVNLSRTESICNKSTNSVVVALDKSCPKIIKIISQKKGKGGKEGGSRKGREVFLKDPVGVRSVVTSTFPVLFPDSRTCLLFSPSHTCNERLRPTMSKYELLAQLPTLFFPQRRLMCCFLSISDTEGSRRGVETRPSEWSQKNPRLHSRPGLLWKPRLTSSVRPKTGTVLFVGIDDDPLDSDLVTDGRDVRYGAHYR